MGNTQILIVDDEPPILELIRYNAEKEGFKVLTAPTGSQALELARQHKPDLIILDLMLPDMSGLDVCRAVKTAAGLRDISVIMVTAKTEDSDIVIGLELGADDYVTKPFSPKVLTARMRSVLRRKKPAGGDAAEGNTVSIHGIEIYPDKHEVTVNGKKTAFSVTEFSILEHLARNPGRVFSRKQIINAIKGDSYPVTERSIDVQILSVRKKLGPLCDIIETIRGIGYRMCE